MAALITMVTSAFSRLMASQLGRWIMAALAWLGITFATQQAVTGPLLGTIQGYFGGVDADALNWLAFFNVDKAITMVLSAYTLRASIGGAKVFLAKRASS